MIKKPGCPKKSEIAKIALLRAKQMMKNKAQMRNGMDRERQKRWMRQRELREDRALKNKRRKY